MSSWDDRQADKNRYKIFPRATPGKLMFGRGVKRQVRL